MMSYKQINLNPMDYNEGDCVVRAIALAMDQDWGTIYLDLCLKGYVMGRMPESNKVWPTYLAEHGWQYHRLQDSCPFCYTIEDFCKEHSSGTFIVATGSHVVCVKDGTYYDSWDSGEKVALFYFEEVK